MKRYIFLGLLIGSLVITHAQSSSDCLQGISTNPDNPVKADSLGPIFHENTFDWRQEFYPTRTSYDCNLEVGGIENPYYEGSDNLMAIHQDALSDFQPADGWELVKRDFGYLMQPGQMNYGTANTNGGTFKNPYLMLYNRFRGELRVFAALPFNQPGQEIVISLTLQDELAPFPFEGYENVNGLFSQSSAVARPLDQETMVKTIASPTAYPDICDVFFYADFHVAYDPCVCYFKSMLEVTFEWVTTATFNAVGQGVGVTQDLASALNSGFDPSQIMADFWAEEMLPPYGQNAFDTLQSGTYIHARAWELYEKHMRKEEDKGNFDKAAAFYFLATVAKVGVVLATKGAAAPLVTVTATTSSFGAIGPAAAITAKTATVEAAKQTTLAKALKVAAPVFGFLSSQFKKEKPTQMLPKAIEFELALRGRIEKTTALDAKTIRKGVPGSLEAGKLPEEGISTEPAYPTYNEALGVFALLETPVVERVRTESFNTLDPCYEFPGEPAELEEEIIESFSYRLKAPLKIAINPAAQIDWGKSDISVALLVENRPFSEDYTAGNFGQYHSHTELGNLEASGIGYTYISPFVKMECLETLTTYIDRYHYSCNTGSGLGAGSAASSEVLYVRFVNTYVTTAIGQDGEPVVTNQILTYPVEIESVGTIPASPKIPFNLSLSGTVASDIRAWRTINIVGDLTTNAPVTISAGEEIEVDQNVSLPVGVTLRTGLSAVNPCNAPRTPVEGQELYNYCNNDQYKANQTLRLAQQEFGRKRDFGISIIEEFSLHPNPTAGPMTLKVALLEDAAATLQIYDQTGRLVATPFVNRAIKPGPQEIEVDLSGLAVGLYSAVFTTGTQRGTTKVVVQR